MGIQEQHTPIRKPPTGPLSGEERFYKNLFFLVDLINPDALSPEMHQTCYDLKESASLIRLNRYLAEQNHEKEPEYQAIVSRELQIIPALLRGLLRDMGWIGDNDLYPNLPLSSWVDLTIHTLRGYNHIA